MADGGLSLKRRVVVRPGAAPAVDGARERRDGRAADGVALELQALALAGLPLQPLIAAAAEADRIGAGPFDVLMASGAFSEEDLVAALAFGLGVERFDPDELPAGGVDADVCGLALRTGVLRLDGPDGRARIVVAARGPAVARLALARRGRSVGGAPFLVAGPQLFTDLVLGRAGDALARRATLGPGAIAPELTVAVAMPAIDLRARAAILGSAVAVIAAAIAIPAASMALAALAGLLFFTLNAFRLLLAVTHEAPAAADLRRSDDRDLPIYTVMVALAREAAVIPGLLDALEALDYPPAKLDIKLLVEQGDAETLGALAARPPRAGIEVLTLPPGGPKTKPRALNAGPRTGPIPTSFAGRLTLSGAARRRSPACRRGSRSTISATDGSPANSRSNTPLCSMSGCRRLERLDCRCRSAAPRTIFAPRRCAPSAVGTPPM